jgi:hypothetical protein
MRLEYVSRTLWIDAICINQSDAGERAAQVAMMRSIHRNTYLNLIWLGPGSVTTARALAGIERLATEADERFGPTSRLSDVWFDESEERWTDDTVGLPDNFQLEPVIGVYRYTWFKRLWVLQEAVLPPSSLCFSGSHSITLLSLTKGATMLTHKRGFLG